MTAAIAEPHSPSVTASTIPGAIAVAAPDLASPGPFGRAVAVGAAGRRPYLAPVPDSAPPFDDEVDTPGIRAVHGPRPAGTELSGRPAFGQSNVGSAVADQESVGAHGGRSAPPVTALARPEPAAIRARVPAWSSEADIGVVRTSTADLPPVNRAASVFARAIIEVVAGHRPVAQLRVHCSPAVYAGLGPRHGGIARSLPHLLSVRVCEPADGIAEVSAVYRRSERVRALAFRLQGVDGRWRITALHLG